MKEKSTKRKKGKNNEKKIKKERKKEGKKKKYTNDPTDSRSGALHFGVIVGTVINNV